MSEEPKDDAVPPLVWTRLVPTGRGRAPGLTHERIAQACLEIADAEGLNALTMRRVSAALGAGTMTLYRYVSSREDLIELMIDQAIGELSLDQRAGDDWRSVLAELGRANRAMLHRHPWMTTRAVGNRPSLGPRTLAWVEAMTAALEQDSLTIDQVMDLSNTIIAFVIGFTTAELAEQEEKRRTGLTEEQWRARNGPYVLSVLATGDYPRLKRIVMDADDYPDADAAFTRRLSYVIEGVGAGLGLR